MLRTELREHIFKMLFQIEFNEAAGYAGAREIILRSRWRVRQIRIKSISRRNMRPMVSRMCRRLIRFLMRTQKAGRQSRMNKVDLTILSAWPYMR